MDFFLHKRNCLENVMNWRNTKIAEAKKVERKGTAVEERI